MSRRVVGLDVGAERTRLVEARLAKGALEILRAASVPTDTLGAALRERKLRGARVVVGVTGRDMILRTTQVPPVPDWQLRDLMGIEIDEVAEQSGDALSADWCRLAGAARHTDEDLVLLALVRDTLIESRTAELAAAGVKDPSFAPNAIALQNAVLAADGGEGLVLAVHLGEEHTDIALVHDGELLFARNLGGGGALFVDALVEAFRLERGKAELALRKLGGFAAPGQRLAGQQGAVARALDAPLRQLVGMLQSSVLLCRNQLKAAELVLDRALLSGPGADIPGLDEALTRALGVPVARFDPTEGYVTGDEAPEPGTGGHYAVAAGLAAMALVGGALRVEILGAGARRRRQFAARTVWLLGAGLLIVAHLVHALLAARGNTEAAAADLLALRREVEARSSDQRTYERLTSEAGDAAARLLALHDLTAPGSGVLAVIDLLDAHLPPELWVRSIRSQRAIEPELRADGERLPFVLVEGGGREQSRGLTEAVTELTMKLRADPAVAGVVPRYTTDTRGGFNFTLSVDTGVRPAAPADDSLDDALDSAAPPDGEGG